MNSLLSNSTLWSLVSTSHPVHICHRQQGCTFLIQKYVITIGSSRGLKLRQQEICAVPYWWLVFPRSLISSAPLIGGRIQRCFVHACLESSMLAHVWQFLLRHHILARMNMRKTALHYTVPLSLVLCYENCGETCGPLPMRMAQTCGLCRLRNFLKCPGSGSVCGQRANKTSSSAILADVPSRSITRLLPGLLHI